MLSQDLPEPELLGVYSTQAAPPKKSTDMLDFMQTMTQLSEREFVKEIIKAEIRRAHEVEIEKISNKWEM